MGSCTFCKISLKEHLKSCVCGNVSYCSKECQIKDWKSHKPSCPPYVVREAPGKGRGLFATRRITEGQVILEELPLFKYIDPMSLYEFKTFHYPHMDDKTKSMILQLHDPAENIKNLDRKTLKELNRKDPILLRHYKEAQSDKMKKIFRIIQGNRIIICDDNNIARVNHACVSNATISWVMGDFTRQKLRAIMNIEKGEEIQVMYLGEPEFVYGSREFRRQQLLKSRLLCLCQCSVCSLEGEDLEDNEWMRTKLEELKTKVTDMISNNDQQMSREGLDYWKKVMKYAQKRTNLVQKLNLKACYMMEMLKLYGFAVIAKNKGISCENDPEVFKEEALKYANMLGDNFLYYCNKLLAEAQEFLKI